MSVIKDWFFDDFDFYKRIITFGGAAGILLLGLFVFQIRYHDELDSAVNGGKRSLDRMYEKGRELYSKKKRFEKNGRLCRSTPPTNS